MTTVLIWLGSGFAFGAGTIVGVRLFAVSSKAAMDRAQTERESLEVMRERNAIDREKLDRLTRIADSLDELELKLRSKQS